MMHAYSINTHNPTKPNTMPNCNFTSLVIRDYLRENLITQSGEFNK